MGIYSGGVALWKGEKRTSAVLENLLRDLSLLGYEPCYEWECDLSFAVAGREEDGWLYILDKNLEGTSLKELKSASQAFLPQRGTCLRFSLIDSNVLCLSFSDVGAGSDYVSHAAFGFEKQPADPEFWTPCFDKPEDFKVFTRRYPSEEARLVQILKLLGLDPAFARARFDERTSFPGFTADYFFRSAKWKAEPVRHRLIEGSFGGRLRPDRPYVFSFYNAGEECFGFSLFLLGDTPATLSALLRAPIRAEVLKARAGLEEETVLFSGWFRIMEAGEDKYLQADFPEMLLPSGHRLRALSGKNWFDLFQKVEVVVRIRFPEVGGLEKMRLGISFLGDSRVQILKTFEKLYQNVQLLV